MSHIDTLLLLADHYCLAEGIAPATLSTRLFNDGKRIGVLRGGGDAVVVGCREARARA